MNLSRKIWLPILQFWQNNTVAIVLIFFVVVSFFASLFFPTTKIFFTPEFQRSDIWYQNYPFKVSLTQNLRLGTLPFWESRIGSGFPLYAEGQVGTWFIPNLFLFTLFPTIIAWNLSYVLAFGVLTLGTYIFLKELGISRHSSLVFALVYGFSGVFATHIIHINMIQTIALMPWMLWLMHRLIHQKVWWPTYGLLFLASQQIFLGYLNYVFISGLSISSFMLFWIFSKKNVDKQLFLQILFIVSGTIGISAVQLLPSIELIQHSTRNISNGFEYVTEFDFPLNHFQSVINPEFMGHPRNATYYDNDRNSNSLYWENTVFIGWIPLLLIGYVGYQLVNEYTRNKKLLQKNKKYQFVLFLVISSVFWGLLVLGKHSPLSFIFNIPGFSWFRVPSRYLVPLSLTLSILAAKGFDSFNPTEKKTKYLIGAVMISQVLWFAYKQNPRIEWSRLQNPAITQMIPESSRIITDNSHTLAWQSHYLNTGWPDITDYAWFDNGLSANSNVTHNFLQLQPYAGVGIANSDLFYESATLSGLLRMSDYYISANKPITLPEMNRIDQIEPPKETLPTYLIYEHANKLPRFFVTTNVRLVDSQESAVEALKTGWAFDEVPLIESELSYQSSQATHSAVIELETMHKKNTFLLDLEKDSWLILQNTLYPGWKAKIDGEKTKVYPANVTFQSVFVPKGSHTVEVYFDSDSFKGGFIISTITGALLLLSFFGLNNPKIRRKT